MKIIYTANIGGYDQPIPLCSEIRGEWEAFYFTDDVSLKVKGWQMIYVKYNLPNVAVSKEIKIRPHRYFPGADYFLWIDSTHEAIRPLNDFFRFFQERDKDCTGWMAKRHTKRNCVYEELYAPRVMKKVKLATLKQLEKFYRRKKMPRDYGLPENGVFFKANTEKTQKISELWWKMMVSNKAYRDQIFLPYAMWKYNFMPSWYTEEEKRQYVVKKFKHLKKKT